MAIELTDEQTAALKKLSKGIKADKPVQTCAGLAGTGKSVILSRLAESFRGFGVGAYTGKAVSVLKKRGIDRAATLHSMLYVPVPKDDGRVEFVAKDDADILAEFDGFLVDEGSMVPADIHARLTSFGLPVVYVGDHGQLEPVGEDAKLMANPDVVLERIHRNAGEIARFAHHLRDGLNPRDFKSAGRVRVVGRRDVTEVALVDSDQVICAFNRTRVETNVRVRTAMGRVGGIVPGDRMICLRNNRNMGVFNGMQGVATKVTKSKMTFLADDGVSREVWYNPNQLHAEKTIEDYDQDVGLFDYAYCITCHKSQGAEFDNVIVFEQKCQHWDHRRWAYTAASRACSGLVWAV